MKDSKRPCGEGGKNAEGSVQAKQKENILPTDPEESSGGDRSDVVTKEKEAGVKTVVVNVKVGRRKSKDPLAMAGLRQSNDHRKLQRAPPQGRQKTDNRPAAHLSVMEPVSPKSSQWDRQSADSQPKDTTTVPGSRISQPDHVSIVQRGTTGQCGTIKSFSRQNVRTDPKSTGYLSESKATDAFKEILVTSEGGDEVSGGAMGSIIEGLAPELLPHQTRGVQFMQKREAPNVRPKGGLLCDDMGLGKTVQSIALILSNSLEKLSLSDDEEYKKVSKTTLVVAPLALIQQWEAEIKEKAPGLDVCVHHGPKRTKDGLILSSHDVVVTTYETLASEHVKRGPLHEVYWLRVILDEAHTIKNRITKNAKACFALMAVSRWCLTGTPIQNNVEDLYSLLRFLKIETTHSEWTARITKPAKMGQSGKTKDYLTSVLKSIMIRRTKDVLATTDKTKLPGRSIHREFIELDPMERTFYDQLEYRIGSAIKDLLSEGVKDHYMSAWVLLLRLRQVCDHSILANGPIDDEDKATLDQLELNATSTSTELKNVFPSSKIKRLLELIANEPTRKTVVFSLFTSMLDIVCQCLKQNNTKSEKYYGKSSKKQRTKALASFRDDDSVNVLLVSLKAGALGLNLAYASRVVLLDPWWNPMIGAQAIDRVYRIGQKHTVDVYELIVSTSIEERILKLQDKKLHVANTVMEDGNKNKETLNKESTANEILQLFK